jgi:adenylate cyclase
MAAEGVKRKLVAILSADVAGFSRLMGENEEATLETLGGHREVIDELIAGHDGRVVGSAGDSVLAEFPSPVEALRCAVAAQAALAERNAALPDARQMRFRVGVNLGDVMVKGDDIFGDGVNVAARLEGLAAAGGICISGPVYDQVRGKLDLVYDDLGPQSVKNIAEPIRVYRVGPGGSAHTAEAPPAPKLELPDRPSIAVLPFENLSGEAEQEYFSDGITEDLITDLSKISGLFVIARNSTFAYKGQSPNVAQVAAELGVRYVLEGSVRKARNRVRINAQLIDGGSGGHLWAERYDRELEDIFAVQDEVTQRIVSALALKLTEDEQRRLAAKGTQNLEAHDCFLRGRTCMWRHTDDEIARARPMFARAVELDPGFAAAHAGLAYTHIIDYTNGWSESPAEALDRAEAAARRAVELDESEAFGHLALGVTHLWRRQYEAAAAEAERVLASEPNSVEGYLLLGNILSYVGQPQQAVEVFKKANRLNPNFPDLHLQFLGQAQFLAGRYDEAAATFRTRIDKNPDTDVSHVWLAGCYGHLGRIADAKAEWAEALKVNPDYSLEHRRRVLPFKDPADLDRLIEGLAKAGVA